MIFVGLQCHTPIAIECKYMYLLIKKSKVS